MKRYWSLFREAVRGSERDYTVGPVGPALVMLSVPMVLEMAMESLFAVVDVFFVSRISADAVATVGVTESMLTIVYTVALGLGLLWHDALEFQAISNSAVAVVPAGVPSLRHSATVGGTVAIQSRP